MLKLGEKSIKSLYFGGKSYAKAYLGEKLVFNKIKKPYYCEVEYLESTGTQWIVPNVSFLGDGYTIKSKFDNTNTPNNTSAFGYQYNTAANANQIMIVGHVSDSTTGSLFWNGTLTTHANRHKPNITKKGVNEISITASNGTLTYSVNDASPVSYQTYTSFSPQTDNMWLFGNSRVGTGSTVGVQHQLSTMKLYYFTVEQNGKKICDMIPVLDLNLRPCMYDKVSGKLFYNQGSGEFLYGREIHEVEYLESTGTQYIDTGIIGSSDTKAELALIITTQATGNVGVFGSRGNSANSNLLAVGYGTSSLASDFNNSSYSSYRASVSYELDTKYICYTSKEERFIKDENGIVLAQNTTLCNDTISTNNLLLFAETGVSLRQQGKMFYAKIWNDNVLIRDYIPAIDENGKAFMFDRVSHTIFDNKGSGEFQYPPVELEYIESTGTQRIDTGISPTNKTKWEIKFAFTKETTGQLMGAGHAGNYRFNLGIESDKFRFAIGSGWTTLVETKDTEIHTWVLNSEDNSCSLDNTNVISTYSSDFSTTNYHIIFCNRAVGSNYCSIKIYGSKIYDNDTLVRDFMTCLLNGEVGLWDKVNKVFYPNAGTGEFLKGKIKC